MDNLEKSIIEAYIELHVSAFLDGGRLQEWLDITKKMGLVPCPEQSERDDYIIYKTMETMKKLSEELLTE